MNYLIVGFLVVVAAFVIVGSGVTFAYALRLLSGVR